MNVSNKNILFIITGLAMGGAENQVVNLADELVARGHKVTLAYILQPALVLPRNEQVHIVWLGGTKSIYGIFKAYMKLARLIKLLKPDVIHSHMFHANILSRLVCIFCNVPRLVCTAHSNNEGGKARMIAYRVTDRLADEFTNVSAGAVESFEKKRAAPVGRMLITHNGIDTNRFKFSPTKRQQLRLEMGIEYSKVFIAIGRFHEAKDYPNLLNAFSKIKNSQSDVHLLVVGDGDLRPQIEQKIQELDLLESVTLLGVRKDIPELLSASDFFVLPSSWEGFGLVVAEAMACERIVIATDSGGVEEVLGNNGFLVAPQDSTALADAMQKALDLPVNLASERCENARQYIVNKFSLVNVVDRWLEIYK